MQHFSAFSTLCSSVYGLDSSVYRPVVVFIQYVATVVKGRSPGF